MATYETGPASGTRAAGRERSTPEILERLQSLGYLGGSGAAAPGRVKASDSPRSPQGRAQPRRARFRGGPLRGRDRRYEQLLREEPKDAALRTSLAGALGAARPLRRGAGAPGHRARARAAERRGLPQPRGHPRAAGPPRGAIEQYRTALRYRPGYEPSRRALARLGPVDVRAARTEAESAPLALAEAAAEAARRGDYPGGHEPAGGGGEDRAALRARLSVPVQRRLPHGRPRGGDRALGRPWRSSRTTRSSGPTCQRARGRRRRRAGGERGAPRREPACLAAGVFAVYAAGACPTIYVGDSGELVTAVYLLGIPHPSGYPLYVLLGKLWTLAVPLGSIAYRMSLFSAACAAASAALLHRLCALAGPRTRWPRPSRRCCSPSARASGPRRTCSASMRSNALFVALATGGRVRLASLAAKPSRSGSPSSAAASARPTTRSWRSTASRSPRFALVTEPGLLRRPRVCSRGAGGVRRGLLPYLYLPLRSRADPPLDWGNPETPSRLPRRRPAARLLGTRLDRGPGGPAADRRRLRAEPRPRAALGRRGGWPRSARSWASAPPLAGAAAAARHGRQPRRRRPPRLAHGPLRLAPLLHPLLPGGRRARRPAAPRSLIERLPALRAPPGAARAALALCCIGWRDFDRSRYRIAEDFSRALLSTLPPGAHLAASDDNILFVLIYLHWVEGVRPDVDLDPRGRRRRRPPAAALRSRRRPALLHPPSELEPARARDRSRGSRLPALRAGRPWPPPVAAARPSSPASATRACPRTTSPRT